MIFEGFVRVAFNTFQGVPKSSPVTTEIFFLKKNILSLLTYPTLIIRDG